MKKIKLFTLFAFLFSVKIVCALPIIVDSTNAYNYWAKRATTEFVFAYMQDYCEIVDAGKISEVEIKGKDNYYTEYIENIDKKDVVQISENFDSISNFLIKNGWKNTIKDLLNPLKVKVDSKAKLNYGFFTTYKPDGLILSVNITGYDNQQMKHCDSIKDLLINGYDETLASLNKSDNYKDNEDAGSHRANNSSNFRDKVNSFFNDFGNLLLYILFFFLGSIITYVFLKASFSLTINDYKKKHNADINKLNQKRTSESFSNNNSRDSSQNKILKEENTRLKYHNEQLIKELDQFGKQNTEKIEPSIKPVLPEIVNKNDEQGPNEFIKQKINIYFNVPDADGSFPMEFKTLSPDDRKLYKIEYYEDSIDGELSFLTGKLDLRAINRKDTTLEPVCDIDNIEIRNSATEIEQLEKGKVRLINSKWIIDPNNKIKIKLI